MEEKFGIEETLTTTGIVATTITAVANLDTNQNGKVETLEALNALQVVAFKVIQDIPDVKALRDELSDLSQTEKATIAEKVNATIQMPSAKAEYLTERAINLLIDVIDFVVEIGKPAEEF